MTRFLTIFVACVALMSVLACAGKNKDAETDPAMKAAPVMKSVALQALAEPKSEGATRASLYGSNRVIWLAPDALVLPAGDIQSASGQKGMLNLTLSDDAAAKVTKYTAKKKGQEIAFIVDGKIIATPMLKEPIRGNKVQITAEPGVTDAMLNSLFN